MKSFTDPFPSAPTFSEVRAWYAAGGTPSLAVPEIWERARQSPAGVWISLRDREALLRDAADLEAETRTMDEGERAARFPLYGLFFAVKDLIDVAGMETTVACPAYAYTPARSAPIIDRLVGAGALIVGKTNMDQFASGMTGTRSPYGACPNAHNPEYISGGSSSGSAYALARGQVCFALGSDTAGSIRVPAGLNNIIGFKPTRGVISTVGVVPASRTVDCLAFFTLECADAGEIYALLAPGEAGEPPDLYSRADEPRFAPGWNNEPFVFGVPESPEFFGDDEYRRLFDEAVQRLRLLGGRDRTFSFEPFAQVNDLFYFGACMAERHAAFGEFAQSHPGQIEATVNAVITNSAKFTAADLYKTFYRLRELGRRIEPLWEELDLILVPTTPTIYTIEQVRRDPFTLNARMGHYAIFANLLDMSGIAVPSGLTRSGLPFGVTMLARAYAETRLLPLAAAYHKAAGLPPGACRAAGSR